MSLAVHLRIATPDDIPALQHLIERSIRTLQQHDYTARQMDGAIGHALGLDTRLIEDRTYFVAEVPDHDPSAPPVLAGCGGWSMRATTFGSDHGPGRSDALLNPQTDRARIRAIFVHPDFARQGLGSLLLAHCEREAQAAGFTRFQMGSTLTGRPLYRLKGYQEQSSIDVALPNGDSLPIILMTRDLVP